jgi:hypothetical protein
MDASLVLLSLHCAETEFELLCSALEALDDGSTPEVAAAASHLARRYMESIGDLSRTQRALMQSTVALNAHGETDAACAAALAGFESILRKLRRA